MRKHQFNGEFARRVEPEFKTFMDKAEKIRWSPKHIAFDKIDYSKLTMADLFAVFVTLHIENYSDVYTKLLLKHYEDLPVMHGFLKNWEREEENHARTLEQYLIAVGMPLDELRANYAKVDKDDFPFPSENQTGLNVFVFFQELLTREMYTKMLKSCREPVLVDILKRVVRDEERHYRFYKYTLGLRFELDKKDTLAQFRKIVRIFGMPQTMFRQKAMTDKLMEYFPYAVDEIMGIAKPIMKLLEAGPSKLLERFQNLQNVWINRRAFSYLLQSPYFWGHVGITLKTRAGLKAVSKKDAEYVQSVIDRLYGLLQKRLGEVAVHDRLAAVGAGAGDGLVAHGAKAVREGLHDGARRVHA
ncbi:MAG: acyl-ACP desaturase [Deltaproteobacteria bacterium]|nr:acyl-ACP desaturase [Deltaproteobacteria bacterium]